LNIQRPTWWDNFEEKIRQRSLFEATALAMQASLPAQPEGAIDDNVAVVPASISPAKAAPDVSAVSTRDYTSRHSDLMQRIKDRSA
jgi:hypothetical protein